MAFRRAKREDVRTHKRPGCVQEASEDSYICAHMYPGPVYNCTYGLAARRTEWMCVTRVTDDHMQSRECVTRRKQQSQECVVYCTIPLRAIRCTCVWHAMVVVDVACGRVRHDIHVNTLMFAPSAG